MSCESIRILLHEAFERTLTADEQQEADRHINTCRDCRAEAAMLKMVVEAVETTPVVQPPASFTVDVMDRLPTPIRILGFIPIVVFRSVLIAMSVAVAVLTWVYQQAMVDAVRSFPVDDIASHPVMNSLREVYAALQTMVGSAMADLPISNIGSPEENPFISVAIAIGVAFVVLRLVNGFESPDWELDMEMESEYSG